MNQRLRLRLMAAASLLLLGLLGLLLISDPNSGGSKLPTTRFAGAISPQMPPARFALRDQSGKLVTAASLRGQPVIVAFLYSTCKDSCPTIAQQIRGALDRLGRRVPAVAVSVDPANDTPASAQRFVAKQQLAGRMRFLLGSEQSLQPLWRQFGVRPQETGLEHSADVVLLDSSGRQRVAFPVSELTPEALAHDINVLTTEQSG